MEKRIRFGEVEFEKAEEQSWIDIERERMLAALLRRHPRRIFIGLPLPPR
jgi:helix-turn-helix protein